MRRKHKNVHYNLQKHPLIVKNESIFILPPWLHNSHNAPMPPEYSMNIWIPIVFYSLGCTTRTLSYWVMFPSGTKGNLRLIF